MMIPGWIARTKIYFLVQDTSHEIKASLDQLCMEGADTVNVRPYMYPYHHENEIENQVR